MGVQRRRVLVLGATGEIGGRVARGCADAGHQVVGVSRGRNTAHQVDLAGVELLSGDKRDERFYRAQLASREFDVVIDSVPAVADVELAHRHFGGRIAHYLMCSSTGTYVPLRGLPADEEHPWRERTAVNFYPQCERDADALARFDADGFPVSILRPTNIIGTGRVPLELWGGRNLHYFRLLRDHQPVELPLCGNTLVQSGCNDDLATAFVNAVGKGPEIAGQVFIISCRRAITLDRYLETARSILGSRSAVEHLPLAEILRRRPGQVNEGGLLFLAEHMCFDIAKAASMLDYRPLTSAEAGLEKALAWCRDQGLL